MLSTIPSNIKFDKKYLYIQWKDGKQCKYELLNLRKYCPCAQCRGGHGDPNRTTLNIESIELISYKKVGRYAISFTWSDGHDAGIYTLDSLRYFCDQNKVYRPPGEE